MFQISKTPKQLTRKVALDVAVSNTSKCLACEATCCKCQTQVHYQCVDQSPIWQQYEQTLSIRNFLGTIEITSTDSKDNQWMIELLLNGKPVQFKIDTGADVTAISEEYSRNKYISMVQPSKHQLIMHGQFIAMLTY